MKRLKEKWNVTTGRLILILVTFAVGGSLTGLAGRRIMMLFDIDSRVLYGLIYILLVTLIWPFMVLLVSIPMGQFLFFREYLKKMARRFGGRRKPRPENEADQL